MMHGPYIYLWESRTRIFICSYKRVAFTMRDETSQNRAKGYIDNPPLEDNVRKSRLLWSWNYINFFSVGKTIPINWIYRWLMVW